MKLAALLIISFAFMFGSVEASKSIDLNQNQSCYSPRPDLYVTCLPSAPQTPVVNQCGFVDAYEAIGGTLVKTSKEACFKGYVTWLVGEKIAFYFEGKYDSTMVLIWGPETTNALFKPY